MKVHYKYRGETLFEYDTEAPRGCRLEAMFARNTDDRIIAINHCRLGSDDFTNFADFFMRIAMVEASEATMPAQHLLRSYEVD